jgi:hypothetical protein
MAYTDQTKKERNLDSVTIEVIIENQLIKLPSLIINIERLATPEEIEQYKLENIIYEIY